MSDGAGTTEAPISIADLQARIRSLELKLNERGKSITTALKLAPVHGNIMGVLMASVSVAPETIRALNAAQDLNVKMAIHRLRARVKEYGITIRSQRGVGYWLDEDDKARVRGLVAPTGTLEPLRVVG